MGGFCQQLRMSFDRIAVIIPAYRPSSLHLIVLVHRLIVYSCNYIVIVDDGSGPDYAQTFSDLLQLDQVIVLRHMVNRGKGAALKTGMCHVLKQPEGFIGVVTCDADGQHDANDAKRLAYEFSRSSDNGLWIGARINPRKVPYWRNVGHRIVRHMVYLLLGRALWDSQCGLRVIPRLLMERMVQMEANGFEFETAMLFEAHRMSIQIYQLPIKTIYFNGGSHFKGIRDSLRIFRVILRYAFSK